MFVLVEWRSIRDVYERKYHVTRLTATDFKVPLFDALCDSVRNLFAACNFIRRPLFRYFEAPLFDRSNTYREFTSRDYGGVELEFADYPL